MGHSLPCQERRELVALLTHAIEFAPSPVAPRIERLGRIRAKPSGEEPEPVSAPEAHRRM